MSLVKHALVITIHETVLGFIRLLDFLLPDLTVFSVPRAWFLSLVARVGSRTRIRKRQYISGFRKLSIGKNCFVNRGNIFDASAPITIGNNCSIGYDNKFITTTHVEQGAGEQKSTASHPITIGNGVWITTNCVLLPGCVIEDNVIVGAGSIVKGTLKKGWVYAGAPAKPIRKTAGIVPKKL